MVRIYALAKELKLDSKELVDICSKAGVSGKGSAPASLTDDELAKVKTYLAGSKSRAKPAMATATQANADPMATRAITRDDYIAPGGDSGKPKVIETKAPDADAKRSEIEKPKTPVKREPVIKLAAIPESQQPSEIAHPSDEPPAQKPIMTLPKDAIRGAKEGSVAPLRQFTKQQDRKRRDETLAPPATSIPDPLSPEKAKGRRRKGKQVAQTEESPGTGQGLAGMASARAARQQNRKRRTGRDDDERTSRRRTRLVRRGTNTAAPRKSNVVLELPCTIRGFSEATGIPATSILRSLMGMGTAVTNINAELDAEVAVMMAEEAGVEVEFKQVASLEETLLAEFANFADEPAESSTRPPVVTFLGHVDHGKTSLLDRILGLNVVAGEAGGITQHIRAYSVEKDGRVISFVDTPGHEAFTEMRARGANVTDIAVLVIAADDGIMPQTEEAISHAKAAEVPIVVALNKIDLPGADANRVLQELSAHDLLPSEWGGDIEVVKTSAITGDGIDDLLETLLLTAELHEYRANPRRPAMGTCLEAQQEGGRGVVAKLIVQNGTLRVGDVVVCGAGHGRVKAMYDTLRGQKKRQGGRALDPGEPHRLGRGAAGRRSLLRAGRYCQSPRDR